MKILSYDDVLEQITKRNRVSRIISLIIGSFIVALIYNSYIVPNNLVYGGVGGLALIVNNNFGISTTLFIDIVTIILVIISIILLGIKKTSYTIIGYLAYTIMINITAPIASHFQIQFDSFLFSVLFHSMIAGLGFGLIYKAGFNTGGSDTIIAIAQKYLQFPTARLSNIINGIIIVLGAANFGIIKSIYAIIYLKINNFISDRIILGVSTSKLCFIKSRQIKEVEKILTEELEVGYTLIDSTNGIGLLKKSIIFCVLPTDRFYDLKRELIKIDKKIEIISNDCYTVEGGKTNKLIKV